MQRFVMTVHAPTAHERFTISDFQGRDWRRTNLLPSSTLESHSRQSDQVSNAHSAHYGECLRVCDAAGAKRGLLAEQPTVWSFTRHSIQWRRRITLQMDMVGCFNQLLMKMKIVTITLEMCLLLRKRKAAWWRRCIPCTDVDGLSRDLSLSLQLPLPCEEP
jgi:hypothetical protein